MNAPLCICNGVIRSGSTWSFNVCRELYGELSVQLNQKFGSSYLEQEQVEQFVTRHWQTVPGPSVIKAHMVGPSAIAEIRAGRAKAVCTYRDPRDCVASDVIFMNQGLELSVRRVAGSLEFLKFYQTTPHLLLVQYEDMMADRLGQIRRIAAHLGLRGDEAMVARVDAVTNLDNSKKLCGELQNRPSNQVLTIQSHRVDPATHLHENHIGNAKTGRWKDELSSDQGRWLTEYFAPWLLQLGYETQDSLRAILTRSSYSGASMAMPAGNRVGTFSTGGGFSSHIASR